MATRTHAREMVVGLLYAYSLGNDNIANFVDMLLEERKIRNAQAAFARGLFSGIITNLEELDSIIELHLKSWEISRLGVIDKCILRLGVYEIIKCNIDAPVAINEAVEIAKAFGEENTGKFVNGILDAISKKGIDNITEALNAKKLESTQKQAESTQDSLATKQKNVKKSHSQRFKRQKDSALKAKSRKDSDSTKGAKPIKSGDSTLKVDSNKTTFFNAQKSDATKSPKSNSKISATAKKDSAKSVKSRKYSDSTQIKPSKKGDSAKGANRSKKGDSATKAHSRKKGAK